jgi:hypothetical protein
MQIGISIMLAYSVFSLRLSEDVPSQSDSVHLISLYLTVCMFFSLSAMTWFAIANKLREKKRLPHWLRWLALDYISWIVCAKSMRRKAVESVRQEQLKLSPTTPSISDTIPLQQITTPTEYSNNYYFERDSLLTETSAKAPLLSQTQTQSSIDQSTQPITPAQSNETPKPIQNSPWIRRRIAKKPLSSNNVPLNKKILDTPKTSAQSHSIKSIPNRSATKNKESLYAIHIYNRLVFLIFLLTVIIINIYTWFFYARTVRTKLLDNETPWSCYDESLLAIVNCSLMSR